MLKKRILCLVLCFSVFVSCAFYKPRQAYAFAATATVAGLALTLAAACGITFLGDSEQISLSIDKFLDDNPEQEAFINLLSSKYLVSDASSLLISSSVFSENRDLFLAFFNSIISYFTVDDSGFGSVTIDGRVVFDSTNLIKSFTSNPSNDIFKLTRLDSGIVSVGNNTIFLLSDMYYDTDNVIVLPYYNSSGTLIKNRLTSFPVGLSLDDVYVYVYKNDGRYKWALSYIGASVTNIVVGSSSTLTYPFVIADDIVYTSDLSSYSDVKYPDYIDFSGSTVTSDYTYSYPSDFTFDDVITGWSDTFDNASNDVIIYPLAPDELVGVNGYDVAYGNEGVAGAVEGVDLPQGAVENPDIPVTPDLSGITGLLNKILSFLKSIPATLIGTKALDFSGFSNISLFDKFPFCIPFDLVNAVNQLNAPPEAPVFKVDFKGTIMESAGSIEIDMSNFEQLAKILRFFEFFGFVAGLIVVTRNLIRG